MMGRDESHFSVLSVVRDKVTKTVSTDGGLLAFEERGEPKQNRTEILLLTILKLNRYAKPAQLATPPS